MWNSSYKFWLNFDYRVLSFGFTILWLDELSSKNACQILGTLQRSYFFHAVHGSGNTYLTCDLRIWSSLDIISQFAFDFLRMVSNVDHVNSSPHHMHRLSVFLLKRFISLFGFYPKIFQALVIVLGNSENFSHVSMCAVRQMTSNVLTKLEFHQCILTINTIVFLRLFF